MSEGPGTAPSIGPGTWQDPARDLAGTLARLLEGRLPPQAFRVDRRRAWRHRIAGESGRIIRLEVQDGTLVLRLAEEGPEREGVPRAMAAWVVRRVHGVEISRRRADLPRWLAQLQRTLHGMSQQDAEARRAARQALAGLHTSPADRVHQDAARLDATLVELSRTISGRVPPDVLTTVEGIGDTLRQALAYADGGLQADTVLRIATDYLPTTLKVHLDLPADWTDPDGIAEGRSGLDLLREQLAVLEQATDDVYQETLADDAARVLANGTFLRDRFGLGADVLDLPETAGAPPPALPEEPRVAAVFRALDLDGDGHLVRSELRMLMSCLGEPMSDQAAGIFLALADADGDGRVSMPELLRQLAPGDLPPR